MKLRSILTVLCLSSALIAGCAMAPANTKEGFDEAYAAASASVKKAASVGGEWRDTGDLLKKAEAAAKSGDYATGVKLANEAMSEGEMGYQQAMTEKNAQPPAYLR